MAAMAAAWRNPDSRHSAADMNRISMWEYAESKEKWNFCTKPITEDISCSTIKLPYINQRVSARGTTRFRCRRGLLQNTKILVLVENLRKSLLCMLFESGTLISLPAYYEPLSSAGIAYTHQTGIMGKQRQRERERQTRVCMSPHIFPAQKVSPVQYNAGYIYQQQGHCLRELGLTSASFHHILS